MTKRVPRIMIAGSSSGCGKTTLTMAILKALQKKGRIAAFKCGPDYIDPMFHSRIIGAKSANLDIVMYGEERVKELLAENSRSCAIAVMEGVMGFYDGAGVDTDFGSSCHLSALTETPVILTVSCQGAALSVGALVKGFLEFKPNRIRAVILNHLSPPLYPRYKKMLEDATGVEVIGFLPMLPEAAIESRHLGLVTADEIEGLQKKIERLAQEAEKSINLERIWEIANQAALLQYVESPVKKAGAVRIGVAYDRAFCFYYEDNFSLLKKMGGEIVYFSPLKDTRLPEGLDGLILGGGYPELYARELGENGAMLQAVAEAVQGGMPCLAECGGFMYLHKSMCGYPMAGVISGSADMGPRLVRFGYAKLTALKDTVVCRAGEYITGHEFHYSESDNPGEDFFAEKTNGKTWKCIHAKDNLLAGYPHLHLWGNIDFAENFVKSCQGYKDGKGR